MVPYSIISMQHYIPPRHQLHLEAAQKTNFPPFLLSRQPADKQPVKTTSLKFSTMFSDTVFKKRINFF